MIQDLTYYFREIVAKSKHLKAFYRMNIDEYLEDIGTNRIAYPCLVMDELKGSLTAGNTDNLSWRTECGFMVLTEVARADYDAETDAYDTALSLGMQVLARITHEERKYPRPSFLRYFDAGSVRWEQCGPLLSNAYGVYFSFILDAAGDATLNYRTDDWDD